MKKEAAAQVFNDVLLGPLLGRGSFGRVHRGSWYNKPVAVKVCPIPRPFTIYST